MKTYQDNGYRYFFDTNIKLWTIYGVDMEGNQCGPADYFPRKESLIRCFPMLKFKPL